ncbi:MULTISPECIES: hypothetical protein [unclassified Streptomyces]|uniref:hypothetical protein n=1 Tax=unclassified Streptomyces TaxID=2593676 RepID=UPI0006FC4508|nr:MULTISPECIES: hypothetical protein [unclassified Streptomyces]KQX52238.1 hypothetical protein ASD33_33250 [Streptomyces sp. Root1304]KRA86656.1 hypothetical protein ASE09_33230 [Streptomyces sp. Root66D1]
MKFGTRRSVAVLAAGMGVFAASLSSAPAAQADSLGCPVAYVCFYSADGATTGYFQDITATWQTLSASRGAAAVFNARLRNGALLHFTNGATRCVRPGENRNDLRKIGTVDKIRIVTSDNC